MDWLQSKNSPTGALRSALRDGYLLESIKRPASRPDRWRAPAGRQSEDAITTETRLARDRKDAEMIEESLLDPNPRDPRFREACQAVLKHAPGSFEAMTAAVVVAGHYRVTEAGIRELEPEIMRFARLRGA